MARSPSVPSGPDALPGFEESGSQLARGATVGRYTILGRVGAGGMGVVYAAYDPELDRRIALKALHASDDAERGESGRTRLIREAKAMARLAHPNVVRVYDVVVADDQVFVAMELVEGESLREWLESQERSWRAITDAFVQAGRGLAAAHDAGMVHRDIKLDNVLVGKDGRVLLGDFGLARSVESIPRGARSKADALGPLVSREGMLAGTPNYMAPDQLHGDPADALSDQFSFCATMYEALYAEPPFEGATLEELCDAMEHDRVRPPSHDEVPAWLRAIVVRGLRAKPGERHRDMHKLLDALTADPSRSRARRAIGAVVAIAAIGVGVVIARNRRAEVLECRALAQRLDGVWDEAQKTAVRAAFDATKRPYAADTFARTARALDAYAVEWSRQAVAGCEARAAGAARALADARTSCLDDRRSELRAFVSVLARAEGETVDRAVQSAHALPSLEVCAGDDPTRERPWPSDAAARADAQALEERMNVASALRAAGRFKEGTELATKNLADAERVGFRPLTASALLALAQVQEEGGDLPASEDAYHRASVAAEAAGAGRVAALSFLGEARRASERGDYPRADERFDHAGAWADRIGDDDALRANLMTARGERLTNEGKYDDARALHLKALALYEKLGSDEVPHALNDLGVESDMQLRYDEARDYYQRALAGYEKLLGPEHPKLARVYNDLGLMAGDQGKYDEAIVALEHADRIRERALGPDHPDVAIGLNNLALLYAVAGRNDEALALTRRSGPIMEKQFGPDSAEVAFTLSAMVPVLLNLHRPADAIAPAEHELAIRIKSGAPLNVADAKVDLGRALLESGRDPARGRALLHEARALFDAAGKTTRNEEIDEALKAR